MSLKKIPAEKVKTKRQAPPDNWESYIMVLTRRTYGYVFFLLTKKDTATGSALNRRFQKIKPVFKAATL